MNKAEAIAAARRMRESHVRWAEHIRAGLATLPEQRIAGDLERHEACIADYDGILAVLETAP